MCADSLKEALAFMAIIVYLTNHPSLSFSILDSAAVFSRFWTIVDNRCPSGMLSSNCRFCPDYVSYVCAVDQTACSESSSQNNNTCPYILCRSGVLDFVKEQMQ